jgi:hypothetical protein
VADGVVEADEAGGGTLVDAEEGGEEIFEEQVEVFAFGDAALLFGAAAEVEEEGFEGGEEVVVGGHRIGCVVV